jgi:hypothetical protein
MMSLVILRDRNQPHVWQVHEKLGNQYLRQGPDIILPVVCVSSVHV